MASMERSMLAPRAAVLFITSSVRKSAEQKAEGSKKYEGSWFSLLSYYS